MDIKVTTDPITWVARRLRGSPKLHWIVKGGQGNTACGEYPSALCVLDADPTDPETNFCEACLKALAKLSRKKPPPKPRSVPLSPKWKRRPPFWKREDWSWRWLQVRGNTKTDRMHRIIRVDRRFNEPFVGLVGKAACGQEGEFEMPGVLSRMAAFRCRRCCLVMGVEIGLGAPYNRMVHEPGCQGQPESGDVKRKEEEKS